MIFGVFETRCDERWCSGGEMGEEDVDKVRGFDNDLHPHSSPGGNIPAEAYGRPLAEAGDIEPTAPFTASSRAERGTFLLRVDMSSTGLRHSDPKASRTHGVHLTQALELSHETGPLHPDPARAHRLRNH